MELITKGRHSHVDVNVIIYNTKNKVYKQECILKNKTETPPDQYQVFD